MSVKELSDKAHQAIRDLYEATAKQPKKYLYTCKACDATIGGRDMIARHLGAHIRDYFDDAHSNYSQGICRFNDGKKLMELAYSKYESERGHVEP